MTGTFVLDGTIDGKPRFRRQQLINGQQYWLYFLDFQTPTGLVGWFLSAQASGYPSNPHPFWYRYTSTLGTMDAAGQSGATGRVSWDPPDRVMSGFSVVADGPTPRRLQFGSGRPTRWASLAGAWVYGYLAYPWEDCYYPVTGLDAPNNVLELGIDAPFGIQQGGLFTVLNIPEELDQPGEWVWHEPSGTIVLWPPANATTFEANVLTENLLRVENSHDVVLRDLEFEGSRATMVALSGDRLEVRGGSFHHGSHGGLHLEGNASVIRDVFFDALGSYGAVVSGGDRRMLTGGGHLVEGNEFRNFSRVERTYTPGVNVSGVGHQVRRNSIHDTPHSAILWFGNELVIELNDIARSCGFSSDCGAVYSGRDFGLYGNTIRHNYIHDLSSPLEGYGVHGVYLDDLASGVVVEGNVFVNVQNIGVMHGGGRDVEMRSNLFVRSGIGIETDARGRARDGNGAPRLPNDNMPPDSWSLLSKLRDVSYQSNPWLTRYPRCAMIPNSWAVVLNDIDRWLGPEGSRSENNAAFQVGTFEHENGPNIYSVFAARQNNTSLTMEPFSSPSNPKLGFSSSAPANICALPVQQMGLPAR